MENKDYKILKHIPVFSLNEFSKNQEVNSIWSYLNFFGKEYLGFLNNQNLKLDYSHSYQRDKFYGDYNDLIKVFQEYGKILQQIQTVPQSNKVYKERLISLETKEYRDLIIKTGKFLYSLLSFVESILNSEKQGETVLLEPNKVVKIEGEVSNIDGLTAKEALLDLYQFTKEFLDFIKMPKLSKIEE